MRYRPYIMSRRRDSRNSYLPKSLVEVAYGIFLILGTLGNLSAQEAVTPAGAPNAEPLPTNPAAGNNSSTDNSGNNSGTDNSAAANGQPTSTAVPNNPALLYSPTGLYSPLLPQQGPNGPSSTQAPQLTTPSLYTTGVNDLSQVATNAALAQAFSQQSETGFYSEPGISYSHGPIQQIRLGPFILKTALSTTVVADDNIQGGQTTGGGKESDTSYTITPAVLVEYGAEEGQKGFASLTYAPTIQRYLHYSANDNDNQNLVFTAQYPFQRLTLNVSESYSQGSGVNIDTNSRTTQSTQVSSGGGSYQIDDKLTFATFVQQATTNYSQGEGQGDRTTSINSSLNYQISEKLTVGPSGNVGEDHPQGAGIGNVSSKFEQALIGANYQPTVKISLSAQAGMEFRQYDQGGGNTSDPIFAAGIGYTPFDSTSIGLNAFRNQRSSSADAGQTVTGTGVGITATQRFVQRFFLTLSASYEHDDYKSGTGNSALSALSSYSENSIVYRPSLAFNPTQWTSVALYYQYQDNSSGGLGGSYHDNPRGDIHLRSVLEVKANYHLAPDLPYSFFRCSNGFGTLAPTKQVPPPL